MTRSARLINLNGKIKKSDVPGVDWSYPDSVSVISDVGGGEGKFFVVSMLPCINLISRRTPHFQGWFIGFIGRESRWLP